MEKIKFGTDGWRGIIADDFNFYNTAIVFQAVADYVTHNYKRDKIIAIGYDTRFLAERFASQASEILAANGIDVILSESFIPTPVVSFAVKLFKAAGAIMITASHNPYCFNGIKFKGDYGGSAFPEITREIEGFLETNPPKFIPAQDGLSPGKIKIMNLFPHYAEHVKSFITWKTKNVRKIKIVFDSMYGTATNLLGQLIPGNIADIIFINQKRDPYFGGNLPEPLPPNIDSLSEKVTMEKADIGFATDGDSDRLGVVDSRGRFITPHQVLALLTLHLYRNRGWCGEVVKTFSTSLLVDRVCEGLGLKLHVTPIGFKHICQLMLERDILIGGEESGGLGVKNHIPERDGFLTAMLLVEMMITENKSIDMLIDKMENEFGKFFYLRKDYHIDINKGIEMVSRISPDFPGTFAGCKVVALDDLDGKKLILEDSSWILFRQSGTEPVLRIYTEAISQERIDELHQEAINLARRMGYEF